MARSPQNRRPARPAKPRRSAQVRRKGARGRRPPGRAVAALLVFAALVVVLALVGRDVGDVERVAEAPVSVPATPPAATTTATAARAATPVRPTAPPSVPATGSRPDAGTPDAGTPDAGPATETPATRPPAVEPAPAGDRARDTPAVPGGAAGTRVAALPTGPLWQRERVKTPPPDGSPRIVVVIDDMGLDRRRSDRIAALPGPLTLAWLPYARNLTEQTAAARGQGHELIVHVPMEPDGDADPGPDAMLSALQPEELRRRLAVNLSAFDGYVGINNHMGSRFTADEAGMEVVFRELAARGLLFLDSRTTARTVAPDLAARHRLPMASRDVFLDHQQTPEFVAGALVKLEEIARRDGLAIAIGHPHDVTREALARWLPTLAEKGFRLIPLSAAVEVRRPES